jgi:hypothetical protein
MRSRSDDYDTLIHLLMRSRSDDYDTETFVNEGKVTYVLTKYGP